MGEGAGRVKHNHPEFHEQMYTKRGIILYYSLMPVRIASSLRSSPVRDEAV